jgi:hypothetical protein
MLPGPRFDRSEVAIPSNTYVRIIANNTDDGVAHNLALYKSRDDAESGAPALAKTRICSGPCKELLNLNLPPGTYFFRCDVHPSQVTGTLTAQ